VLNEPTPRPRRRHLGKLAAAFFSLAVVGLISSELFLRAQYGLGDPPRMMDDPLTEYRYAPDGHYRRRGNAIDINQYSMRSDAFPAKKTTANERRVLVIGDSIVNGGAQSDQRQLATSILQVELRQRLNVPCVVGNVSAGSWGPQNMLGYVRRFGLLDADAVVIVVSSHDAFDQVTTFPSAEHIQPAPYWFAFGELIDLLWARVTAGKPQAAEAVPGAPGDSILCLDAFEQPISSRSLSFTSSVPNSTRLKRRPGTLCSKMSANRAASNRSRYAERCSQRSRPDRTRTATTSI
jgi:hypothetical protein